MLTRIWHGRVPTREAEDYLGFLRAHAVPDYAGIEGCLGVYLLHRTDGDVTHVQTLTFWESEQHVRAFAGDDVLRAKYYAGADAVLLEQEPEVRHFETVEAVPLR